MRKFILRLILTNILLSYTVSNAQSDKNKITIGNVEYFHSKILNEERKLLIYVPDSEPDQYYKKGKYPVIYLLDGEGHFNSVTALVEYLSAETVCPKMIIVGITNTNRFRDLTPTKPASESEFPLPPFVGGGEAFTSFLEKELIPYIDSIYPTTGYRMMIGHSLGGLMVINTLLHHHNLFKYYLAIDPSLWWDHELLPRQADSIFKQKKFNEKSLYLAMSHIGLSKEMDLKSVLVDTSEATANARPILSFTHTLESADPKGFRWKFQFYPDESHGTVPLIAEYDAIRFLFSQYSFPVSLSYKIREPNFNADSAFTAHFKKASELMGYVVLPPENFVNENAYAMLQNNDMERAYKLFNLNIRNYPDSYNVYDSMGDFYMAENDKENAILYYNKALELKEVSSIRKKLEMLIAK